MLEMMQVAGHEAVAVTVTAVRGKLHVQRKLSPDIAGRPFHKWN